MKTEDVLCDIADRIGSIENLLKQNINPEQQLLINHGISGFKEKILTEHKVLPPEKLNSKIRKDKSLRFPHRKILEYLSEQYDYQSNEFHEVHFSKIVQKCRLGKNMAKAYLDFLVKKGYLGKRGDGYRVWYCVDSDLLF